jgi:3-phosphoshikimate 1-carboxyvinyltransferase
MSSAPSITIRPFERIGGSITVPGDKSLSHRAVILASLADGISHITGFLGGEDCLCTLAAMQSLGAVVEQRSESDIVIEGTSGKLHAPFNPIDCGNSSTALRLLAGLLAGQSFKSNLFGDAGLSNRPWKRILDPLIEMGAKIEAQGPTMRAPFEFEGSALRGITHEINAEESHLKSSLLLAGLFAKGTTCVKEKANTRDHTERLMNHFHGPPSIEVDHATNSRIIRVRGGTRLYSQNFEVPGDISTAAFFMVAAAAQPGAELVINRVGLNPSRTRFMTVLLRMGAQIQENIANPQDEPIGTLHIRGSHLRGTKIHGAEIAQVINELPILAVAGALAEGETEIRDAGELRLGERDKIVALVENLRVMGVPVEEHPDGLTIKGRAPLKGAHLESYSDHRVAMACAILALFAKGDSVVHSTGCISSFYSNFKKDLDKITTREESLNGFVGFFGRR